MSFLDTLTGLAKDGSEIYGNVKGDKSGKAALAAQQAANERARRDAAASAGQTQKLLTYAGVGVAVLVVLMLVMGRRK